MKRIEFRLSMPGCPSWNGKWSGAERRYAILRKLADEDAAKLFGGAIEKSWSHHWSDGWTAQITARLVPSGERFHRADGFCGYDWMVENILDHGTTRALKED